MTSDVKCLPYRCTVAHIYTLLSSTTHNAFPIVDVDLLPILKHSFRRSSSTPGKSVQSSVALPSLQECIDIYCSCTSPGKYRGGNCSFSEPFVKRRATVKSCGVFMGLISRQQLTVVLQKKFFVDIGSLDNRFSSSRLQMSSSAGSLSYEDFYTSYPRYASLSEVELHPEDLGFITVSTKFARYGGPLVQPILFCFMIGFKRNFESKRGYCQGY